MAHTILKFFECKSIKKLKDNETFKLFIKDQEIENKVEITGYSVTGDEVLVLHSENKTFEYVEDMNYLMHISTTHINKLENMGIDRDAIIPRAMLAQEKIRVTARVMNILDKGCTNDDLLTSDMLKEVIDYCTKLRETDF